MAAPRWVTDTLATINGNRGLQMLGAKAISYDTKKKAVNMRLPRNSSGGNFLSIRLTSLDLYDIEIRSVRTVKGRLSDKLKASGEGLYASDVGPWVEEHTGMYLSMGTMGQNPGAKKTSGSLSSFNLRKLGLDKPIKTKAQARTWLKKLHKSPFSFHLDDPTWDIPNFGAVAANILDRQRNKARNLLGYEEMWEVYHPVKDNPAHKNRYRIEFSRYGNESMMGIAFAPTKVVATDMKTALLKLKHVTSVRIKKL